MLQSRSAEAEQELAFAGLGDLLEDALDVILPSLPTPRRQALQGALLLEDDLVVDPRALALAVRSALEALAVDEPVLVAVDDVQWLDPSSSRAVAFALRRTVAPLRLLLSRRRAEGVGPSEIEGALDAGSVEHLAVGSLSAGALQALIRDRLDRTFSRPTLARVHETSGGNPFYALEFARSLATDPDPTRPLPIPATLETLVTERLAELPDETREALALVSAVGTPSVELIETAGVLPSALPPALDAHVVESSGGVLHFTHPLLASVLYQGLTEDERRSAHRRIADVVEDPVARARHVAVATSRPDAAVAALVDEAADAVARRGAMTAALELREHALRLTPPEERDDVFRRMIAAAKAHLAVAEIDRARTLSDALLAQVPTGRWRAEALMLAADAYLEEAEGVRLHREALRESEGDLVLQARIHQWLGWSLRFLEGLHASEEHLWAALEIGEKLDDDALRAGALGILSVVRLHLGQPDAVSLGERGYALARKVGDPELLLDMASTFAVVLMEAGQLERAHELLNAAYDVWSERDEWATGQILWRLASVELARGRLALAADHAERAREIAVQYEAGIDAAASTWTLALVDAHRGALGRARTLAEDGLRRAQETSMWFVPRMFGALGLVEAWEGDPRRAVEHFSAAEEARGDLGSLEPNVAFWRADYVEALLALGRRDDALAILDPWEVDAARLDRSVVLAQAARCRGLIAAAQGDVTRALGLLEEAAGKHEAAGDPFGRARSLLALGIVRRRARQRRASRGAIDDAIALFEECGAVGWAEKARTELGAIGGRTRTEGLTSAETRVAALVAKGKTNREVAAALFLGERTVETHLTHIYAKLGIRSRTELARALASSSGGG